MFGGGGDSERRASMSMSRPKGPRAQPAAKKKEPSGKKGKGSLLEF